MKPLRLGGLVMVQAGYDHPVVVAGDWYLCVACTECAETIAFLWVAPDLKGVDDFAFDASCPNCLTPGKFRTGDMQRIQALPPAK